MIVAPPQLLTTAIPALTTDGARGRVRLALLNPGHWRLLALVVRYGRLSPRDVIVPLKEVAAIGDKQVRLRLSRAELEEQPAFRPAAQAAMALGGASQAAVALQYGPAGTSERVMQVSARTARTLAGGEASPADGLIALRAGLPVLAGTQRVGRLGRLLFDAEGRLRQLVVRTGRLFGRDVAVPVERVAGCDDRHIRLDLDRAAFERLPEYRDDAVVRRDVERALRNDDLVRRLDLPTIDVSVSAGAVVLRGHARAATSPARAELAARGVPGVREVVNQIVTDGELHLAVVDALGRDERTRARRHNVYVQRGVVVLHGTAGGPTACAEAVAGSVPGVRAVISIAAEGRGAGEEPRALFPRIGQEVYASQTRLGRVERVVAHPRHRRVTALVVQGQAVDPRVDASGWGSPAAQPDQGLIIPVEAVRAVTQTAVLLHPDDKAAAPYPERRLKADAPGPDWQPPYPYTRDEVLLEREPGGAVGARPDAVIVTSGGPALVGEAAR